jgi:phage terminase small subunit
LTKPDIAEFIQARMDARARRIEITADNVLKELAKIGFGNVKNLYGEDGRLLHVKDMDPDTSATITEIVEERVGTLKRTKYKVADKKPSLELLGKNLKLFTDKIELGGKNGGKIKTKWEMEITHVGKKDAKD